MNAAEEHYPQPRLARVDRWNQITLPTAALAAARVRPGDVLRVEVKTDGVLSLVREHEGSLEASG
ncbi:hypothetical protein GCM10012275_03560 [Longimycelium tulufanense]|uniref:SpoVT-AbrB domain-containing protein n=1 Tax=Longimycelium tulufanense TaxID=907463 RepID=A0A8J3FTN8_9PSEU|nr:hypothetical protein [Longimycelium tulufanense]GGM35595.1 hypothetical protein GCM10012275_03560 [Longimycelium tulufanense]